MGNDRVQAREREPETSSRPNQFPPRLQSGDEIRVLALSRSLGGATRQAGLTEQDIAFAVGTLREMGLTVSFGAHVRECDAHLTTSRQHRLADFHQTIASPWLEEISAVTGGLGAAP